MDVFSYYKLTNEEMKQFNDPLNQSHYYASNREAEEYIIDFLSELQTINKRNLTVKSKPKPIKKIYNNYFVESPPPNTSKPQNTPNQQNTLKPLKTPTYDISEIERKIDTLISEKNSINLIYSKQADNGITIDNYKRTSRIKLGNESPDNYKYKKRDIFFKGLRKVFCSIKR